MNPELTTSHPETELIIITVPFVGSPARSKVGNARSKNKIDFNFIIEVN